MRLSASRLPVALLAYLVLSTAELTAQQVTVSTPYHSLSDSYYENMGTSWGLSGPNWSFRFGGSPTQAAPQFGGFDPNAGANFGLQRQSGGNRGFFNGNWSSGYRQSFVSQTPSVTLTNGVPGFIADASQSPFVISYVPIVGFPPPGGYPRYAVLLGDGPLRGERAIGAVSARSDLLAQPAGELGGERLADGHPGGLRGGARTGIMALVPDIYTASRGRLSQKAPEALRV